MSTGSEKSPDPTGGVTAGEIRSVELRSKPACRRPSTSVAEYGETEAAVDRDRPGVVERLHHILQGRAVVGHGQVVGVIVGVTVAVANHVWGAHATEFLATGTAIRRLSEEHRLPETTPKPTFTLGLDS